MIDEALAAITGPLYKATFGAIAAEPPQEVISVFSQSHHCLNMH